MAQFIQLASAFGGALGFACVFNIRGKKAFLAAVGGAIGWGVFLLVQNLFGASDYFCGFAASIMLTVYAEYMDSKDTGHGVSGVRGDSLGPRGGFVSWDEASDGETARRFWRTKHLRFAVCS